MKQNRQFLVRPQPCLEESLAGFFLRLVDSNSYDSVRWIFQLANLSKYEPNANLLVPGKHSLHKLSELTGIQESTLWSMAFPAIKHNGKENYVEAFNRIIPSYFIHKTTTKICPKCLEELPFRRKVWDISTVTSCPKHRCLLIDVCPQCQTQMTWSRSYLLKCKCGFDLRCINITMLAEEETILSLQIQQLCDPSNLQNKLVSDVNLAKFFYLLEMEELLTLTNFLAGQFVGICDATGKQIATQYQNSELHLLLIKSLNLLTDWPNEFYKFLDWRKSQRETHDRDTGIARDFGSFYKKLYTDFSAEPYSFLRKAFEDYLSKFWDGGYFNSKLGRIENSIRTDKVFIPGTEAAQVLGLSEAWVLKLVEQGVLDGSVRKMGTRSLILVKRDSVATYQQSLKTALTLKEVAAILSINHRTVVGLVDYSCIQALRGPKSDGYRQWLISSESVETFLQQVEALSNFISDTTQSIISFSDAIRRTSGLGYTAGKLMRLVLDRKVEVFQDAFKNGLDKYYFLDDEVNELIQRSTLAKKDVHLTVVDIANLLGVKQEVVRFWIDKKFIKCKQVLEGKHRRRQILEDDLKAFRLKYVSAVELAIALKTSPKKVVQLLAEQQVTPITGPNIDGGRQYLFQRRDVEFSMKEVKLP